MNIDNSNFILKPKNDYVFKKIFGDERNKDILIAFLKAVLKIDIEDVQKDYNGSKTVVGKVKELRGELVEI